MAKFLLLFVGLPTQPEATDATTQSYVQQWRTLLSELASEGVLESSLPLIAGGKTVTKDSADDLQLQQIDIGAYMLINVATIDDAVKVARRAPHTALGGTTLVRPCLDVGA